MASEHVDVASMEWISGVPFFGPNAVHEGTEVVQLKVLSDHRAQGGGIAWLLRFAPPPGKLLKIVAVARSDEHVFRLEGGRSTKSGKAAHASGAYSLNPRGQPHSAMIAEETVSVVVYSGEPDEIRSLEVVPVSPSQ